MLIGSHRMIAVALLFAATLLPASAETTLILKTIVKQDRASDDFAVEVKNGTAQKIDISEDWQNHTLIVDGKPHRIMETSWWCMDSSVIEPGLSWERPMSLNYYLGISLPPGRHEIQMQLGQRLSNKLVIIVPEQRSGPPSPASQTASSSETHLFRE